MTTPAVAPPNLDHVVITTPDLAEAVRAFESATGVAPQPGGVHPTFGTRNYLVSFGGDAYLEILGADPENVDFAVTRPFGIDNVRGTAVSTWAVHPAALDDAIAEARRAGAELGEAFPGSRRTGGGTLLQWRLTADHAEPSGLVPFLIDWGTTTSPAVSTEARVDLVALTATHLEPQKISAVLAALGTRLDVRPGEPALRVTVEGPAGRLTL